MNKTLISIKKLHALVVNHSNDTENPDDLLPIILSFNAEMMRLGFIMSKDLFQGLKLTNKPFVINLYNEVLPILKLLKGDDVKYHPMYPNFPQQVMEMDYLELYLNAVCHYWSFGEWKPFYQKLLRQIAFEQSKFIEIGICSEKDFVSFFTTLISSNASLSEEDKEMVNWYLDNYDNLFFGEIPFKETLCIVASKLLDKGHFYSFITNATDILRVMTYLSNGDLSLAENTKFKSLPKAKRKLLVSALELVINEDDIARHKNKWTKAFHNLHVGDYKKSCPKVFKIASKIRNGENLNTFNSKVEQTLSGKLALDKNDFYHLLSTRPGDFARRLDHVLRSSGKDDISEIINKFKSIVDKVSTRVLLQVQAHFNSRCLGDFDRVAFPKGRMGKAVILTSYLLKIEYQNISDILVIIENSLIERFKQLSPLNRVWIDPNLNFCPIPMQQRSVSTGLFQVARGTHLPMGNKNTLRFFIYWVGDDIDLSATLHDNQFKLIEQISYTHLKSSKYQACHSGDITRAPNGAAEFIDITIDKALECGARYLVMNVYVFRGPNFSEHKTCYAGWMTKDQPDKGEIFDPKLVEQKIDLRSEAKNVIPIVFDLQNRQGIWCDLIAPRNKFSFRPNNVENNRASIEQVLRSIVNLQNKPNLYQLFEMHAKARGVITENKENADTVFSISGGITPFDVNIINSKYLI